jgi:hypothetical protein
LEAYPDQCGHVLQGHFLSKPRLANAGAMARSNSVAALAVMRSCPTAFGEQLPASAAWCDRPLSGCVQARINTARRRGCSRWYRAKRRLASFLPLV